LILYNGENYSILTLGTFAGQAGRPTIFGMTITFGEPSAVSDSGGLRKSNDGAAGVEATASIIAIASAHVCQRPVCGWR
jgi:hypothetical protein